jgi:dTMP kinase
VGTLLRQALSGRLVLPGGAGPLAPETLALLFAADRTDHLRARVLPALARGEVVVCVRYVLSSLAYQGISLPMAWVDALNARALSPDLTLFVEVSARVAAGRRAGRGGPAELFEEDAQQRRIARQYRAAIRRRRGRERIVRLDGEQPVEAVTRAALDEVRRVLPRRRAGRPAR